VTIALHPLVLIGATDGQLIVQELVALTTVVVVDAELSAACSSFVLLEILAELVMLVPFGAFPSTANENVRIAVSLAGRVAMVQFMMPFASGLPQVKGSPESCVSETNVVPPGTEVVSITFWAGSGPRLMSSTL
jgi:hypothetical protein